jgi:hypothetical protein
MVYRARDVRLKRDRLSPCLVLLAGASPPAAACTAPAPPAAACTASSAATETRIRLRIDDQPIEEHIDRVLVVDPWASFSKI